MSKNRLINLFFGLINLLFHRWHSWHVYKHRQSLNSCIWCSKASSYQSTWHVPSICSIRHNIRHCLRTPRGQHRIPRHLPRANCHKKTPQAQLSLSHFLPLKLSCLLFNRKPRAMGKKQLVQLPCQWQTVRNA